MAQGPGLTYVRAVARTSKGRFRTAAEWQQLIEEWEASGLGAERFATGRDFSGSSLYVWRKRLGGAPRTGAGRGRAVDFAPVVFEESEPMESGEGTRWELQTASGLALTMSGPDAVRGLEIALRFVAGEAQG